MAENGHRNPQDNAIREGAPSPVSASHPPRFYRAASNVNTTDSSSLMDRVVASLPASVQSPGPQRPPNKTYTANQPQHHGFVLSSPPSWSTGVPHCFHHDMTPMFCKSDLFRCDECWRKPEAGWLYTCTQAVVKPDGSIDPRNQALLEPMVYTAVKDGKYTENEVKILIKQRLNALNVAREAVPQFYPPRGSGPGYGALYQSKQAKEESLNPERQRYLRENGLRVRFSGENSYRSPSPRVHHDHEEEEGVKAQESTSEEQQHPGAGEEDDFDQYVAWVNTVMNMRNQYTAQVTGPGSYIPYRAGYENGDQPSVQTVEDIHVERQPQPEENQPEVFDLAYFERLRREMHSFDYHRAVGDMHWSAQHDEAHQQSDVSRRKPQCSPVECSNQGSQTPGHGNHIAMPAPVCPASQNSTREHHRNPAAAPLRAYAGNQEKNIPSYHDAQVQFEISRGRSLHRQISNSIRGRQTRNNRRAPFVLNIHNSDEDQAFYQKVPEPAPARPVEQQIEYRRAQSAGSVYLSNRNPRPLPQPPPRPSPPRPLYPCDYKICAACRGEIERLVARFNAGNSEQPIYQPTHIFNSQEQLIFFRPDFADSGSDLNGVPMRDAQYFMASNNNETELRHPTTSRSTIVNFGDTNSPAPGAVDHSAVYGYGENLASRMERLAVDSSSGGSDHSTDESVDAGEGEVLASYEREV